MLTWLQAEDSKGLTPLHHVAQHGYTAVADSSLAACSMVKIGAAFREWLVQMWHSAGAAAAAAGYQAKAQLPKQHTDLHLDIWAASSAGDSYPQLYHAARVRLGARCEASAVPRVQGCFDAAQQSCTCLGSNGQPL
jgi:hypothetical protein